MYRVDMAHDEASKRFAELGNSTRLIIVRYLVRVGKAGVPVGELQKELGIPGSTLSHHISRLVSAGLIQQKREGRTLYCFPQFEILRELIDFLMAECCAAEHDAYK